MFLRDDKADVGFCGGYLAAVVLLFLIIVVLLFHLFDNKNADNSKEASKK